MTLLARLTPPAPKPQPEWIRRLNAGLLPAKVGGLVADSAQGPQRGMGTLVIADATQPPVRRGWAA